MYLIVKYSDGNKHNKVKFIGYLNPPIISFDEDDFLQEAIEMTDTSSDTSSETSSIEISYKKNKDHLLWCRSTLQAYECGGCSECGIIEFEDKNGEHSNNVIIKNLVYERYIGNNTWIGVIDLDSQN